MVTFSNQGTEAQHTASLKRAINVAVARLCPAEAREDVEYAVRDLFSSDVHCDEEHLIAKVVEYLGPVVE